MCAMLYINYVSVCMKNAFVKALAGCTFQQHYLGQSSCTQCIMLMVTFNDSNEVFLEGHYSKLHTV